MSKYSLLFQILFHRVKIHFDTCPLIRTVDVWSADLLQSNEAATVVLALSMLRHTGSRASI
jgi:hypothetical protein